MLLPFVRELFADVEQLPAFTRAASHLRESAGRIRVTGLSPTAKTLITVLLRRAVERPFLLVVADNRAAEDLLPVLRAFAELTGAADPDSVVILPARDVLPFQNLSPHPEIQEERATALWKIATGRASIVVAPVGATTIRLRSADYYADLARVREARAHPCLLPRLREHGKEDGGQDGDNGNDHEQFDQGEGGPPGLLHGHSPFFQVRFVVGDSSAVTGRRRAI